MITVESEATPAGVELEEKKEKKKETKAKPRSAKKYKEPPKDRVQLVASSFKDVYSVLDVVVGMAVKWKGHPYPDGLMELEDEKAMKLARSLCQMNDSLPRLAERMNKVAAPAVFFSTLITDLAVKGAVLYGIVKSPKPGAGTVGTAQVQSGITH